MTYPATDRRRPVAITVGHITLSMPRAEALRLLSHCRWMRGQAFEVDTGVWLTLDETSAVSVVAQVSKQLEGESA